MFTATVYYFCLVKMWKIQVILEKQTKTKKHLKRLKDV